jgi:hypothetical protein
MTQRATDTDGRQSIVRTHHFSDHAHDSIQFQQLDRHCRIVQINLAGGQRIQHALREGIGIDFQTDRQRDYRTDILEGVLHLQHLGPQLLVAKRIVAED